jgi:type IV secretory pathway TrbL component
MKTTYMALGILCGMAGLLAGCGGNYYKVNDPAGSKLYYTTDIEKTKTGAITFKDKKSGSKVSLQSSEVKDISKEEFEAGIKVVAAAPAQAPVPAAAPTPAAAPAQAPVATTASEPAPAAAAPVETPAQPADSK